MARSVRNPENSLGKPWASVVGRALIATTAALSLSSAGADSLRRPDLLAKELTGIGTGWRAEWWELGIPGKRPGTPEAPTRRGSLRIFKEGVDGPGFEIKLDVNLPVSRMELRFVDLTGDGASDLVFLNSTAQHNPLQMRQDVMLWLPSLPGFVHSNRLSQVGYVSQSGRPGCVNVERMCGSFRFDPVVSEELCFRPEAVRWQAVKAQACPQSRP